VTVNKGATANVAININFLIILSLSVNMMSQQT